MLFYSVFKMASCQYIVFVCFHLKLKPVLYDSAVGRYYPLSKFVVISGFESTTLPLNSKIVYQSNLVSCNIVQFHLIK